MKRAKSTGGSTAAASPGDTPAMTVVVGPTDETYKTGEKVLCRHSGLLYEAKVLRIAEESPDGKRKFGIPEITYLVHYTGWSARWDEWVLNESLFKYNDENLYLQKRLKLELQEYNKTKKKSKKSESRKSLESTNERSHSFSEADVTPKESQKSKGSDAKTKDKDDEIEASRADTRIVSCTISDALKNALVDDWERIKMQKKLHKLPCSVTIEDIIHNYLSLTKSSQSTEVYMKTVEYCEGVKDLFNDCLMKALLYDSEKAQLNKYLQGSSRLDDSHEAMTEVYGICHLLRFFVKQSELLHVDDYDPEAIDILVKAGDDFLSYLNDTIESHLAEEKYITT